MATNYSITSNKYSTLSNNYNIIIIKKWYTKETFMHVSLITFNSRRLCLSDSKITNVTLLSTIRHQHHVLYIHYTQHYAETLTKNHYIHHTTIAAVTTELGLHNHVGSST